MEIIQTSKLARLTTLEMKSDEKGSTLTARLETLAWISYFLSKIRRYSKRAKTWYPAGGARFSKRADYEKPSLMVARLGPQFGGILTWPGGPKTGCFCPPLFHFKQDCCPLARLVAHFFIALVCGPMLGAGLVVYQTKDF